MFEEFQNCWDNVYHPYLRKTRDYKSDTSIPDLTIESEADKWIRTSPEVFCNTKDKQILSQVLNNYDQETTDFYRWKVAYSQKELSELILKRSGVDYGEIIDLVPIERGTSGRLIKLKIIGTKEHAPLVKSWKSDGHFLKAIFIVRLLWWIRNFRRERNSFQIYPDRCRMGTRCGTLPNRRICNG